MNRIVIAAFLSISTIAFVGCQQKPALLSVHGKSVSDWVTATKDRDPRVRKRAVAALQSVGCADLAAIPALAVALQDQDASVRDAAALALLNIGPDAKNSPVRIHAAAALARIQSRS